MSIEPSDIYEYRAALLEWHQENVGQTQRLYLAQNASTLLSEMREDILRYANLLYNRYAMAIDETDLHVIQQHFSSTPQPGRGWNHDDIKQLLSNLIQEHQDRLAQYDRYQSIIGVWYDLLEWVNDLLPGANHVMISLEDSVPNFVHRLFDKYFDNETIYQRDQSPQDVNWLGKLALLHLGVTWWEQPDGLHFLHQIVKEHNELFGST